MLHELILALHGHIGGMFVAIEGRVKVVSVPFLHPGEESILNRICEHATHYRTFTKFIEKYQDFKKNSEIRPGVYMNSLCHGLREVLKEYENDLITLENECMMNSDMTLTQVQDDLEKYILLFPSVAQFLQDVEKRKARGCQLLDLVYKYTTTGIPSVKTAMKTLLFTLHKVMYKQLSSWLLYGTLVDKYDEFFVHKVRKVKSILPSNQDDELGILGLTGAQLQLIQGADDPPIEESYCQEFSLRSDMIPSYLPARLLHMIVFIGELVDMFENNENHKTKKTILKHKATEFAKALFLLSQAREFRVINMENQISAIRECVAERLWEYVIHDSHLKEVLNKIKDIQLLGRGDLYSALIESADVLLSCPPTPLTNHELSRTFHEALRRLDLNDEQYQRFKLSVELDKPRQNGWMVLSAEYKPEWPLHVFFTPSAIERYNVIFRFLLAVKRVHISLHRTWKLLMSSRSQHSSDDDTLHYQLTNHMLFLVDNLQYYLQVDVIESQFTELLQKIDSSRDFEVIRQSHETFQASLLSQCFLLNMPVNHCLMCILDSCQSFSVLMESSANDELSVDQREHITSLRSMFQKQTLLLFKILTNTKTHQRNPYLVQLLLRIDYNNYFSSAGQHLG